MNYIVLVKQVPDTKHIPREAWDWEKGTLRRALLENVCNELDKQALAFAIDLRREWPGRIVALTMGPPFAEDVLRYALSIGADSGVLLSDRRLGGADTPATAYPIARAVRKIESELFSGNREYVVVAGVQSVDGDTAQVPPQVAEELEMAHVAYVNGYLVDQSGQLNLKRATQNGTERIAVTRFPFLATLTERTSPYYPTFRRTRWAHAQELHRWDADAIGAEPSRIGVPGSRTAVVRIFPAKQETKRRCQLVSELDDLIGLVRSSYGEMPDCPLAAAGTGTYSVPEGEAPEYSGELWVYAEHDLGELRPVALELLGKARDLADTLGESVGAVVAGAGGGDLASKLVARGADKVYIVSHDALTPFTAIPHTRALAQLIEFHRPQVMLFGATPLGRELAPRVAYAVKSGLTADCTELALTDLNRGKFRRIGILLQTRPALGGNIMASIVSQNSRVQMSTARPGVFKARSPDLSHRGEIIRFEPDLSGVDPGVCIQAVDTMPPVAGLADAEIIVAGGRGCRTKENFDRYVGRLADALGKTFGVRGMAAASRAAVDAGFVDRGNQVGQTGQSVSPRLYVALGISGAVQHLTGIRGAGIVVAIDKDPGAQIFRNCDYGFVGEMEKVVPYLISKLKLLRGEGTDGRR